MKKILTILTLSVLLVLAAGCGGDATGDVIKDTDDSPTPATLGGCGDGECTENEMCNIDTLKAGCAEDCGECPGTLYTKGFDCKSGSCRETSENTFEISGDSSIGLEIVNLGEVLANTLKIDYFKCYSGNTKILSSFLLANYKGYIFRQEGFGDNEDEVRLKARGTHGSKASYVIEFEIDPKSTKETPFELQCKVNLRTHSPFTGDKEQVINLNFK